MKAELEKRKKKDRRALSKREHLSIYEFALDMYNTVQGYSLLIQDLGTGIADRFAHLERLENNDMSREFLDRLITLSRKLQKKKVRKAVLNSWETITLDNGPFRKLANKIEQRWNATQHKVVAKKEAATAGARASMVVDADGSIDEDHWLPELDEDEASGSE